jgi:hypothetical protein
MGVVCHKRCRCTARLRYREWDHFPAVVLWYSLDTSAVNRHSPGLRQARCVTGAVIAPTQESPSSRMLSWPDIRRIYVVNWDMIPGD